MLLSKLFAGAALFVFASALPTEDPSEPEVIAEASFPETNPFGHIINGEKNQITLTVENKSELNVTLLAMGGSFNHPDTGSLIKNTTVSKLMFPLPEGIKLQLPYSFHSEMKTGDVRLNLWLEHAIDGTVYRVPAYDSIVTVVEPALSIFDFKMITTYLTVAGILSGLSYFAYLQFAPQGKAKKSRKSAAKEDVSSPVGSVTATGAGGYQEEWIPEHHLKKSTRRPKGSGGLTSGTSGDELSPSEVSGTEGRKKKGKK